MVVTQSKLTFDSDDGRPNNYPNIVVAISGQAVVFYAKTLLSGRTSDSRTTFTAPFTVNVQAGSGTLNGVTVNWGAAVLVVPSNSFQIVYVNSGGTVSFASSLTMHAYASSVILAFVYVGGSAITRLEEVEKTGKYIFVKYQIFSGGNWIWDDYEYIANTGEEPGAFYNIAQDRVYLSYKKDSISYVRSFNLSDPLSFQYIPNVFIDAGPTIHLNRDPTHTFSIPTGSSGRWSTLTGTNIVLYQIDPVTGLGFFDTGSGYEKYLWLPLVASSGGYLPYVLYPYYVDVYTLSGSVYSLETTFTVSNNTAGLNSRWQKWTLTNGLKYIGIRVNNTVLQDQFVLDPSNYLQLFIHDYNFGSYNPDANNIRSFANYPGQDWRINQGSGYESLLTMTFEYEETRDFEQDSIAPNASSGYENALDGISYDQIIELEQDSMNMSPSGSGYSAVMILVNS